MPNGNSPGSGINCPNSSGWRRRRRWQGSRQSFRGAPLRREPGIQTYSALFLDSGPAPTGASRNDDESARPAPRTPLISEITPSPLGLDFPGLASMFRATFGKFELRYAQ